MNSVRWCLAVVLSCRTALSLPIVIHNPSAWALRDFFSQPSFRQQCLSGVQSADEKLRPQVLFPFVPLTNVSHVSSSVFSELKLQPRVAATRSQSNPSPSRTKYPPELCQLASSLKRALSPQVVPVIFILIQPFLLNPSLWERCKID